MVAKALIMYTLESCFMVDSDDPVTSFISFPQVDGFIMRGPGKPSLKYC